MLEKNNQASKKSRMMAEGILEKLLDVNPKKMYTVQTTIIKFWKINSLQSMT